MYRDERYLKSGIERHILKSVPKGKKNENERIHVKIMLKNDRAVGIDSSDVELLK